MMRDYDDKDLVIVVTLIIVVGAMAIPGVADNALQLAEKALYGLFGLAVGKAIGQNGN